MKTLIKLTALSLILTSVTLSCKRDEMLNIRNTEYITFKFTEEDFSSSGTITKGSCDTLSYEITDWEYNDEESDSGSQTKGALTETLSGQVGIFAKWSESSTLVMDNDRHTVNGKELIPDTKVLWKNYTSGTMTFLAYAPYDKNTALDSGKSYFTYTVPTDVSGQKDLLTATAQKTCSPSTNEAISLTFKHSLTAIQFKLGFECTIKEIRLCGIASTGRFFTDGTMQVQSDTTTYKLPLGSTLTKDTTLNDSNHTLIMLPQSFTSDKSRIELVYNDGTDHTISASLKDTSWPAGKKVVYTLNNTDTPIQYIYFDLGLGDICLTAREGAEYYGYINVAGTRTEVTGIHNNNNRYYIYQSIKDTDYPSDHNVDEVRSSKTGYATQADWEAKKNCRIPQYKSDIMYYTDSKKGGKWADWGAYITNNPDPHTVITDWNKGDQNYSTANKIQICGHETNPTCFDITLDRVYSKFFPYFEGGIDSWGRTYNGQDKQGAITIGDDQPGLNHVFRNYGTEQVTLRLKNNNVLGRIHYKKPVSKEGDGKSWLKITSADGDGISKGTLCVITRNATTDAQFNMSLCALIGSGTMEGDYLPNGQGFPTRQVCDLFFEGGIVYVGTRAFGSSEWTNNRYLISCIGGPNSESHVTVNGGTLTSVSNTSAPAIGGGGGWEGMGGKGVVNINGGNVYAYSFGVCGTYSGSSYLVASTAIGGASTLGTEGSDAVGGPGEVNISGGNVYAYSVGGVALGGGTSGLHAGGESGINISGGTVTAISAPGKIAQKYSISAGTAIGGGRAGASDGNGGTATVTISGGVIQSGSVGGGKCDNASGKLGRALVTVSDGEISAQFLLVKDPSEATENVFRMTGGSIRNSNTSDTDYPKVESNGGAVYMESGNCIIENGTIDKCSAALGGAVYMNSGKFIMSGGTISNCNAATHGGGVYIDGGNATVSGGCIEKNLASKGNGGGVYVSAGDFSMPYESTGKINYNSADADPSTHLYGNGGGIYVRSTTRNINVNLIDGEVQYNASDYNGGGLCVDMSNSKNTAVINIGQLGEDTKSPYIASNSAALSGGGMAVDGSGSNIYIYSGTVKGNVSARADNQDIRNDGGMVDLVGKNSPDVVDHVDVNYKTITFYANNGYDPEPYDEQRVITATNSPLCPTDAALAFEKEFYHKVSWNTKRDGSGTTYKLDGTDETMNITSDISLYAQWVLNTTSN